MDGGGDSFFVNGFNYRNFRALAKSNELLIALTCQTADTQKSYNCQGMGSKGKYQLKNIQTTNGIV